MTNGLAPAWAPMLAFSTGTWIASALVVGMTADWSAHVSITACIVAFAIGVVCVFALRTGWAALPCVCLLGCCAGVMLAASASVHLHSDMRYVESLGEASMSLCVLEDSREGDFGSSCIALASTENGHQVRVRVNLPAGSQADCWQRMEVHEAIKPPTDASRQYYWSHGLVGSVTLHDADIVDPDGPMGAIYRLRHRGIDVFDQLPDEFKASRQQGISLLKAILFGSRRELFSSDFYNDVKVAGLAHIVAVSGAHLVIVSGFFAALLKAMRVSRRVCIPLQAAFVFSYVAFTGMPVSAMRAAIMSLCASGSFIARRRSSSVTALGLCALGMVGLDPFMAVSISLALSCLASLGIVLLARPISNWLDGVFCGRARFVSKTLGATLAANALTIGLTAALFSQVPLVAPLSNLVAAPMFGLLVGAGLVATGVGIVFSDAFMPFMRPVVDVAQAFCETVHLIARIPFASVPVDASLSLSLALTMVGLFVYLKFFRLKRMRLSKGLVSACFMVLAGCIILHPLAHGCEVVMLDVGQGDALVYRKGSHAVLIDTGTNDAQILAGLARHDVRSLDAIVISHPDDDHCGSLGAICDVIPVTCVCVAADLLDCGCENCNELRAALHGLEVMPLAVGDVLEMGPFDMAILAPSGFKEEGGNADSLIMDVGIDCDDDSVVDWRVFTSGDAEASELDELLQSGEIPQVDIVKVPHHGSANALDEGLLDVMQPTIALIGVGEHNRYGHPTQQTLQLLEENGVRVYRTDQDGDITCRLHADRCDVRTQGKRSLL